MSQSTPGAPRPSPFYGWWMVWLGGFLSSLIKTAINKGFPVFVAPVREGFGASNAAVALIFSLARAQSGPTGLLAGWFIDRCGPRRAVLVGALLSGGGFLALGYTTSLWAFGVLYLLVVTTGANLGFSYALATLINNWFYRRKAFAMSAFQAVDSFVPAVLVGVIALAIAAWGWQTTATVTGLVLLMVIVPLSFCLTDAPERLGLTMDGDPPGGAQDPVRPAMARRHRRVAPAWRPPEEYSLGQTLRSWVFCLPVWSAIVRDGAPVSGARLGRGPLLQTVRADVGLPGRHGLLCPAGLALPGPRLAPGVRVPVCHLRRQRADQLGGGWRVFWAEDIQSVAGLHPVRQLPWGAVRPGVSGVVV